jgi:hypothetical protein
VPASELDGWLVGVASGLGAVMTSVALVNPQQAHAAITAIYAQTIKPGTMAGHRYRLTVREETRREGQNAHFHAIIADIAKQDQLYGKKLDAESWKRLLIDAFKHETKDMPELAGEWAKFGEMQLLPALNHAGFVAVGEQSRTFTVRLAAAFIEWLNAYAAERGLTLHVPKSWGDAP